MSSINSAIQELFQEVLRGTPPGADGTWFVQGNEALNTTLDDLSADEASRFLGTGINSIAAHVIHATYYLELANDNLRGRSRDGDWAGSWARQVVSKQEWTEARAALDHQAIRFLEFVKDADLLADPDQLTEALANVGHAAYHLGAIRQLYLVVKLGA